MDGNLQHYVLKLYGVYMYRTSKTIKGPCPMATGVK